MNKHEKEKNDFCSNEMTLGGLPNKAFHKKPKLWLKACNFQPHLPFFEEGRGAGNWVNNWSCLLVEASTKIPTAQVLGASRGVNMFKCRSTGPEVPASEPSPPSPYTSLHLAVYLHPLSYPSLCHEPVNVGECFSEFCWPFWQNIKPKEGVMGTSMYNQWVRSTVGDLGLGKVRPSCGFGTLICCT